MRFLWVLVLCACGLTEPRHVDTTFTLPVEEMVQVTAPGGTNYLDVRAVGAGGNNNIFIRGSSGAWIVLEGLPFTRGDTLIAYVAKALPVSADPWFRPVPTWLYTNTLGGFVLTSGTPWDEVGQVRMDSAIRCCTVQHGAGSAGNYGFPGQDKWGFGGGGSQTRPAGNGMIRVRFYTR